MNYELSFDQDSNMFVAYCKDLELRFASLTEEDTRLVIESLIKYIEESGIFNGINP